ncbi:zf-HC2 domain-containing protein [Ideonella sp.]|uniref:zf-HC2 domain-containing protein n=1 Tax=Ideonella sp. TaxID=1929293 RepID=UPI0035AFDC93
MNDEPTHPSDPRPDHLRAWAALPWVVNGHATPEQARWVSEHVATCEDCRAELAWQQRLHDALAAPPVANPAAVDPATEAGLQRLLARLDDVADEPLPAPRVAAAARGSHRLTWALAAAVVVQAVGLGVMSFQLAPASDGAAYRTLSEAPGPGPAATLRVMPDATMTLAQWQSLLQAQALQVVSGPNAGGAYALAPAPGAAAAPRADALARLRASPGIRLAEPIGSAP